MPIPSKSHAAAGSTRHAGASGAGHGRLDGIQVARGLAALAVLLYHARFTEEKYFGGVNILPVFLERGQEGVDFFFVLSGFVMGITTVDRHGSLRSVGRFLWARLFRIYPTYWFYYLALVPVALLLPQILNQSQGGQFTFAESFFLWPTESLPLLMVAWTLTLELWFYVVFAVFLFLPRRFLPLLLAVWAVALIFANLSGPVAAVPILELPANAMALEFIFGVVAALLCHRLPSRLAVPTIVIGAIVVLALGTSSVPDLYAGPGLARPFTLGVGFALIVAGVAAWERSGIVRFPAPMRLLGDMSYSLYLSHVIVLGVMGRAWMWIAERIDVNEGLVALWWLLTLVVSIGVAWLSYRWIERPLIAAGRRTGAWMFAERRSSGEPQTDMIQRA